MSILICIFNIINGFYNLEKYKYHLFRKIPIDNSVKYVPITEKDIKQNTTKNKKKFNLFQEDANKTKNFQKIMKNS